MSKMPCLTWDSDSIYDLENYQVTKETVVPDDIWNKFDLDCPVIDNYHCCNSKSSDASSDSNSSTEGASNFPWTEHQDTPFPTLLSNPLMMKQMDKLNFQEKIRHDCMWTGLCISDEHSPSEDAKKKVEKSSIPAGHSLLIPKNTASSSNSKKIWQGTTSQSLLINNNNYRGTCRSMTTKQKNLESDGDSTRPPTPQSSIPEENSETESEESEEEVSDEAEEEEEEDEEEQEEKETIDEIPIFRHQLSINGLFSASASEVTGQEIQRRPAFSSIYHDKRKESEKSICNGVQQQQTTIKSEMTNTHFMSDHCYYSNSKKMDHLGVQTPSDSGESEEEIDVVNFDKPVRPDSTALTLHNPAEQHYHLNQLTVNSLSAYKDRKHTTKGSRDIENVVPSIPQQNPTPRPRGRPPLNPANRKRPAPTALTNEPKSTKRARNSTNASKSNYQRKNNGNASPTTPQKQQIKVLPPSPSKSSISSDDEPDTEKRSMHNNMERQRRVELRQAFEMLRLLVPALCDKEKAPKVAILRQSASYCDKLGQLDLDHKQTISDLRKDQDRLRARLSQLRRSAAMQR